LHDEPALRTCEVENAALDLGNLFATCLEDFRHCNRGAAILSPIALRVLCVRKLES
jgi:hypothetical protein